MLSSKTLPIVITVLLFAVSITPDKCTGNDFSDRLRGLASRIPHLNPGDVVYNRLMWNNSITFSDDEKEACEQLAELTIDVDAQLIEGALRDDDPKVRTLAIVAAYNARDPRKWLPEIHALTGDRSSTFPTMEFLDSRPLAQAEANNVEFHQPQTVGRFASYIIKTYMDLAGMPYGIDGLVNDEGVRTEPGFEQYMEARKDLAYCPSWFKIEMIRASQGSSHVDDTSKLKAIKARIGRVPSPDREWIFLCCAAPWEGSTADYGGTHLASETELVQILKELEPDVLLRFLQREKISDHVELQFENERICRTAGYPSAARFILKHASQLLDVSHTDSLIEFGKQEVQRQGEFSLKTKRWVVAAVDLDPPRAQTLLTEAISGYSSEDGFEQQDENVIVATAMWRHLGESASGQIVDWFFGQPTDKSAFGFGIHRFCTYMHDNDRKPLLIKILKDERLDLLDAESMKYLITAVNEHSDQPVVTRIEIDNAWHPYGLSGYHDRKEEAKQEYPDESAALEACKKLWRDKLVAFADSQ